MFDILLSKLHLYTISGVTHKMFDILLSKLHLYSISGVTRKCFSSYLNNYTQKCLVNGSFSECCTVECGIPQGTILGPLPVLFLLYINDLLNVCFILNLKECMLMIFIYPSDVFERQYPLHSVFPE